MKPVLGEDEVRGISGDKWGLNFPFEISGEVANFKMSVCLKKTIS